MVTKEPKAKGLTGGNRKIRWRWVAVFAVILIAAVAYAFLGRVKTGAPQAAAQAGPAVRAIPVGAVTAKKGDMNVYIIGLGAVTPVYTVTIKSRVDGQLMEVFFKEGQMVRKDDLLATIDPRPYQAQLLQTEGQLARDQALLKNSQIDLERYRVLWKQDSIPKQQLDTQEYLVRQYEGAVKMDQGQVDNARVQVVYTRITAPISGRIGLRLVDPGNIVHAADTNGLLVITQLQPITVIFPIPEDSLPAVLAKLKAGQDLPVDAWDRAEAKKLSSGSLLTVDNQIDTTTGTVRLRAIFENRDNALFPNQFVNAHLLINVLRNTVIVPAGAILRGSQGTFVYAVRPDDHTAQVRMVAVGEIQGPNASVQSGLAPGDLVVVDGAERVREGVKVELRMRDNGTPRQGG
jgi:multidrug efflux system membrane fusion protein